MTHFVRKGEEGRGMGGERGGRAVEEKEKEELGA